MQLEVVIEIPKWSFVKRGTFGHVDFISPFPCPFNYGARVTVTALGAVGLSDRGMYDDKIVCGRDALKRSDRRRVLQFFRLYGQCKRLLNLGRGRPGLTRCEGWGSAEDAVVRARPRDAAWQGSEISF
jgi:inorganic pyrophosphatase